MKTNFKLLLFLLLFMGGYLALPGIYPGNASTEGAKTLYLPQAGTPISLSNFLEPDDGCNTLRIGGQLFDQNGIPVVGLIVRVEGLVDGTPIDQITLSGSSERMGAGGFELRLLNRVLQSRSSLTVTILSISGAPLSMPYTIIANPGCDQNMIIFNLVEFRIDNLYYLPFIIRNPK